MPDLETNDEIGVLNDDAKSNTLCHPRRQITALIDF